MIQKYVSTYIFEFIKYVNDFYRVLKLAILKRRKSVNRFRKNSHKINLNSRKSFC